MRAYQRVNSVQNFVRVSFDSVGQRQLNQNAVNSFVSVEGVNFSYQLIFSGSFRQGDDFRFNAEFLAGFVLVANVDL